MGRALTLLALGMVLAEELPDGKATQVLGGRICAADVRIGWWMARPLSCWVAESGRQMSE
jgi:hypothetical protein